MPRGAALIIPRGSALRICKQIHALRRRVETRFAGALPPNDPRRSRPTDFVPASAVRIEMRSLRGLRVNPAEHGMDRMCKKANFTHFSIILIANMCKIA